MGRPGRPGQLEFTGQTTGQERAGGGRERETGERGEGRGESTPHARASSGNVLMIPSNL